MIHFPRTTIYCLVLAALFAVAPVCGRADGAVPAAAPQSAAPRVEAAAGPRVRYADRVLNEDTVWSGEVLVEGVLAVAPQATLTVAPGTTVRFRKNGAGTAQLVVEGRLVATGTKESPILFGSGFADPAPADWQGILLLGSEKRNQLENCRFQGAETGVDALFSRVTLKGVWVERAVTGMSFQDSVVSLEGGGASSCDTGLYLSDTEATLLVPNLTGNRVGVSAFRGSLYLSDGNLTGNKGTGFSGDSCRLKIQGGTFQGNRSGITLLSCEGSVTGAKLVHNREFGLSLSASRVKVVGNLVTGNGNNGILAADGSAALWDNAIYDNAGYDLYYSGIGELRAPANWWGGGQPKLFDNGGRGRILYSPVLGSRPQPQPPR